jgi:hypothetical protein
MAIRVSTKDPGMDPYNNYMDLSAAANSIDKDIARDRKIQQEQEQKRSRDLQLGMMKSEYNQGFMIPSTSKFQPINAANENLSRKLVDQASSLVSQLEKNEIDTNQFAVESAKLKSQVPQIKQLTSGIDTLVGSYTQGLTQGTLSKAITPKQERVMQAISNGKGEFAMDENNILVFQGESDDNPPVPFSIPANKIQQMPLPINKVPPFESLVKPMITAMSNPVERVGRDGVSRKTSVPLGSDEFEQTVRAGFDDFLNTYKESGLRSLAADYAGYTYEQIEKDLNSGEYEGPDGEMYSSKLEYDMEEKYSQIAVDSYIYKEQNDYNQLRINEARENRDQQRADRLATAQMNETQKETFIRKTSNQLQKLPPPVGISGVKDWLRESTSKLTVREQDGKVVLVSPGNKLFGVIDQETYNDPNKLAKLLATSVFGVPGYAIDFNYNIKTSTPLQKLSKFLTGKK